MKKCCNTCKLWLREQDPPSCGWPEPKLPFWASISNGDHGDYTEPEQGRNCQTYEAVQL